MLIDNGNHGTAKNINNNNITVNNNNKFNKVLSFEMEIRVQNRCVSA